MMASVGQFHTPRLAVSEASAMNLPVAEITVAPADAPSALTDSIRPSRTTTVCPRNNVPLPPSVTDAPMKANTDPAVVGINRGICPVGQLASASSGMAAMQAEAFMALPYAGAQNARNGSGPNRAAEGRADRAARKRPSGARDQLGRPPGGLHTTAIAR